MAALLIQKAEKRSFSFLLKTKYQSSIVGCKIHERRYLSSNSFTEDKDQEKNDDSRKWLLRYSHENSFLSWSRNAAICAGVGATLSMFGESAPSVTWSSLTFGFIDLGLLFMTIGSLHHIGSSLFLKRQLNMTNLGLVWTITYTTTIWLGYFILIQGNFSHV